MNSKRLALLVLIASWLNYMYAQDKNGGEYIPYEVEDDYLDRPEDIKWWRSDKFGLFIHWGPYAVTEGYWSNDNTFDTWFSGDSSKIYPIESYGERLLHYTDMPLTEYEKIPGVWDWSEFDAQDCINLCFSSGQRYITITTKHHDGFAIWPSETSDWNIGDRTPYGLSSGRDPLKELADACQATKTDGSPWEIKLCFYYSQSADWYEPDAAPMGYEPHPEPSKEEFAQYIDRKVIPQLTELLTNYGDIGMIWCDVPTPRLLTLEQATKIRWGLLI